MKDWICRVVSDKKKIRFPPPLTLLYFFYFSIFCEYFCKLAIYPCNLYLTGHRTFGHATKYSSFCHIFPNYFWGGFGEGIEIAFIQRIVEKSLKNVNSGFSGLWPPMLTFAIFPPNLKTIALLVYSIQDSFKKSSVSQLAE